MQSIRTGERGSAVLTAVMSIFLMSGMGAITLNLVATNEEVRILEMDFDQADGVAEAGSQFAARKIYEGFNPEVTNLPFDKGTFTVTSDPNSGIVTTVASVGGAKRARNPVMNFGKNCLTVDTSNVSVVNNELRNIRFTKTCNAALHITDWTLSWAADHGERSSVLVTHPIGMPMQTLYSDFSGYPSGTKVNAVDYTVSDGAIQVVEYFRFLNPLPSGLTYTLSIHLADGSTKTISFTASGGS